MVVVAEVQYKALGRENNAAKTTNKTSLKLTRQNQRMAGLRLRGRTVVREATQCTSAVDQCSVPVQCTSTPTAAGGDGRCAFTLKCQDVLQGVGEGVLPLVVRGAPLLGGQAPAAAVVASQELLEVEQLGPEGLHLQAPGAPGGGRERRSAEREGESAV